jgi:hypothetical protein
MIGLEKEKDTNREYPAHNFSGSHFGSHFSSMCSCLENAYLHLPLSMPVLLVLVFSVRSLDAFPTVCIFIDY